MATQGVAKQLVTHQTIEAFKALAHVDGIWRKINARGCAQSEHALRLAQQADQALQRDRIKTDLHTDPPSPGQLHPQRAVGSKRACPIERQLHRKQSLALLKTYSRPPAILVQRSYRQAMLRAEGLPRQTTLLELQNKFLGLNPAPATTH
jgi:hypothetical protein